MRAAHQFPSTPQRGGCRPCLRLCLRHFLLDCLNGCRPPPLRAVRKVFPQYEVLGWYSTGSSQPADNDIDIQRSLIDGFVGEATDGAEPICETPIYLLLDTQTQIAADGKDLPITAFESVLRTDPSGETSLEFEGVENYRLKPESGEQSQRHRKERRAFLFLQQRLFFSKTQVRPSGYRSTTSRGLARLAGLAVPRR